MLYTDLYNKLELGKMFVEVAKTPSVLEIPPLLPISRLVPASCLPPRDFFLAMTTWPGVFITLDQPFEWLRLLQTVTCVQGHEGGQK